MPVCRPWIMPGKIRSCCRYWSGRKAASFPIGLRGRRREKTLERHRNYLVAILLAYTNGYEIIRGHLSRIHRRENP